MTDGQTPQLLPDELRFFTPFQRLENDELILLAGMMQHHAAEEGTRILHFGDTDRHQYFLLSGAVELEARDGMRHVIESGGEMSRTALAGARPCEYSVVTLSPAQFIKTEAGLLDRLNAGVTAAADADAEWETGLKENRLYQSIKAELRAGRLSVPSLPEVALRIKKAVEEETASIGKIARIISVDPAITAKLIKIANGPLYRSNVPIDNCQAAIVRLGMNTTKQLVISLAMRDLFRIRVPELKSRVQETWRHSTEVGAISMILARLTPHLEPEQALLAGLLHDIGVVPILCHVQHDASLVTSGKALDLALAELRGEVGGMILRRWGFNHSLVQAALKADDWHYDSGGEIDYAELVILAQLHSHLKAGKAADYPPMERLPAFAKLAPQTLTPQSSLQVIDQARGEVAEVIRLLSS